MAVISPSLVRLRVDQVGSLLRPASLKDAYRRHDTGELSDDDLRRVQDEHIRAVVAAQEAHNVPIITDGEFRRVNFQDSFAASAGGYEEAPNTIAAHEASVAGGAPGRRWDPGYGGSGPATTRRRAAVKRLSLVRNQPLEEYRFTRTLTARPVKVTLVGVDRVSQRFAYERSRAVYADLDAFVADVVRLQRQMVSELVEAGCPYVHIDEPGYTAYVDEPSLEQMRARGEDPQQNLERSIAADNAVIAEFPDVTFGVHLCRGNQRSMWHREGSYDTIAEQLFSGLAHQRLLLEYDTERAGSFAPLRFVPKGKVVVLGLVSTKVPDIESPDTLKRRIEEATQFLPIEQLAISPQCGFASDIGGNLVSEDDQWRKFEVLNRVAEEIWGRVA